jgi:zinc transporter
VNAPPRYTSPGSSRPDELPGLIWGFGFDRDGRPEALDPEIAAAFTAKPGGWIWLHFDLLDQRCQHWLSAASHFGTAGKTTLLSSGDHQHFRIAADCLAGVLADTIHKLDGTSEEVGHWRFALTGAVVVSAGRHALDSVEAVRRAIQSGIAVPAPANLVEAILEEIAGDCEKRVVALGSDLDRVEDRVLADAVHDERRPLAHLRRRTVRLHRRIGNLLIMIHRLDHQAKAEPAASLHAAVGRVVQRLTELEHELREMQERGRLLQEEIAAKLATETNNYLQAISVLTALFLPPTLIVGIFGMNTKGLPLSDDADGFIWVMLLSALCSAGAYWLLKRAPTLFKRSGLLR